MKKRSFLGLLPIVYLLCVGGLYSAIHEMYESQQSRQGLINLIKPDKLFSTREGYLKKKMLTDESLNDAIRYLKGIKYIPESLDKADIQNWNVTSDSTAYLICLQDTFCLASNYYTLKTPLGIILVK